MARTKSTARRSIGHLPPGAIPAPESHPVIAAIILGLNELWRNRYKNLVGNPDSLKTAAARRQPVRNAPPSTTTGVARSSRRPGLRRLWGQPLILEIPLEIVVEIGKHLHPQDLYSLAMTCTQINRMLTSKSTRFLWKVVLDGFVFPNSFVQPPPQRPEHMNELQYVAFLFGQRCMACDGTRDCTTSWTLHVRLCSRCKPLNMASVPELIEFIRSKNPRMSKAKMLEIIHAIASSDPLYRAPLTLFRGEDMSTFRMRDEAHLIISTLLEEKKKCPRAKRHVGINDLVAGVSRLSTRRIWAGVSFRRALIVLNPGAAARRSYK